MKPSAQVVVDIIRDIMRDPNARRYPLFSSPGEDASPVIHMSQSLMQYLAAFTNNAKTPLIPDTDRINSNDEIIAPLFDLFAILSLNYSDNQLSDDKLFALFSAPLFGTEVDKSTDKFRNVFITLLGRARSVYEKQLQKPPVFRVQLQHVDGASADTIELMFSDRVSKVESQPTNLCMDEITKVTPGDTLNHVMNVIGCKP